MRFDLHLHFPKDISAALNRIGDGMASMALLLAAVDRIASNVDNVRAKVDEGNAELAAARAQLTDLQAQIANGAGITSAQLQQAIDSLDAADRAFDEIAPEIDVEIVDPPVEDPGNPSDLDPENDAGPTLEPDPVDPTLEPDPLDNTDTPAPIEDAIEVDAFGNPIVQPVVDPVADPAAQISGDGPAVDLGSDVQTDSSGLVTSRRNRRG